MFDWFKKHRSADENDAFRRGYRAAQSADEERARARDMLRDCFNRFRAHYPEIYTGYEEVSEELDKRRTDYTDGTRDHDYYCLTLRFSNGDNEIQFSASYTGTNKGWGYLLGLHDSARNYYNGWFDLTDEARAWLDAEVGRYYYDNGLTRGK